MVDTAVKIPRHCLSQISAKRIVEIGARESVADCEREHQLLVQLHDCIYLVPRLMRFVSSLWIVVDKTLTVQ